MGESEAKTITFIPSKSGPAAKPTELRFIPVLDTPATIAVGPTRGKAKGKKKSKAKVKAKGKKR